MTFRRLLEVLVIVLQDYRKSLPDAFSSRKAEGAGIAKIQGLVNIQNPP
jgi:hypothetical protein